MTSYRLDQLRGAWGAGYAAADKGKRQDSTLIGRYFHSTIDGHIEWQGQIVAQHDARYEIQLYSWLDGRPTNRKLVTLDDMADWVFYDNHGAWVEAGDKVSI